MNGQISMFDIMYPKYKITKPIRLIEFFAGYGSQALALKYLDVEYEHWKICEWAIKSIQAYKDIHFTENDTDYSKDISKEQLIERLNYFGISSNYNEPMTYEQIKRLNEKQLRTIFSNIVCTNNLVNICNVKGQDLDIVDTDKYEYVLTYSFPCQDLSLAGKGKGMSDTSTRSGMLWEVERILTECHELGTMPQILLMENVPQVHQSGDNARNFLKWQSRLEELGYKNYVQDLIATDYGIPQTRNRCFMVSILGDYSYIFPKPIPLKLKLKDLLEDNVDEKYYLSSKQIQDVENWGAYQKPLENMEQINKTNISPTLTTRSGAYAAGMVLVKEEQTLKKELCDKLIQNGLVKENDVIRHNYTTNKDGNCIQSNNESPTLDTRCDCLGVVINKIDISQKVRVRKYEVDAEKLKKVLKSNKKYSNKEIANKLNVPITTVEHWFRNDNGFSVPDASIWHKLKKILEIKTNEFDKSITTFEEKESIYEKNNRCYFGEGVAPTLTATSADEKIINNLRIRKLIPREAFRLMGVKDEDYEKCAENQSDSSLYHLAGDSIVVNVLMAIFKEML